MHILYLLSFFSINKTLFSHGDLNSWINPFARFLLIYCLIVIKSDVKYFLSSWNIDLIPSFNSI